MSYEDGTTGGERPVLNERAANVQRRSHAAHHTYPDKLPICAHLTTPTDHAFYLQSLGSLRIPYEVHYQKAEQSVLYKWLVRQLVVQHKNTGLVQCEAKIHPIPYHLAAVVMEFAITVVVPQARANLIRRYGAAEIELENA